MGGSRALEVAGDEEEDLEETPSGSQVRGIKTGQALQDEGNAQPAAWAGSIRRD